MFPPESLFDGSKPVVRAHHQAGPALLQCLLLKVKPGDASIQAQTHMTIVLITSSRSRTSHHLVSTLAAIKVYPYLRLLATLAKVLGVKRSNSRIFIQPG